VPPKAAFSELDRLSGMWRDDAWEAFRSPEEEKATTIQNLQ
jgi:hypothetical protein